MTSVRVPGRVNLIGEHTDYNDGASIAFALDYGISVERLGAPEGPIRVISATHGEWRSDVESIEHWELLAAAVVRAIEPGPGTFVVRSDLPVGVGLSSSAAYVGALALAAGASGSLVELAELVQRCEAESHNDVGLLDPLVTLGAHSGHLLHMNFLTLDVSDVAWPRAMLASVVDSGVARHLASTPYQGRRAECAIARDLIGDWNTATMNDVNAISDERLRRRARHVVSELARVQQTLAALKEGDVAEIGRLVTATHQSLSEDFDVSLPEIDDLVATLCKQDGVFGARLVGGGFGGCVLVIHDASWAAPLDRPTLAVSAASGALELLGHTRNG